MGLLTWIKEVIRMFTGKAKDDFEIEFIDSDAIDRCINLWENIYSGKPPWLDSEDDIKTINFAKTICSETARLSTLDIGISFDGEIRSEWMQEQSDKYVLPNLRKWMELACEYGTIAIKPNGKGVDYFTPNNFRIVDCDSNGRITAIVFQDSYKEKRKYYTKLEYHRFIGNTYQVTTKTYVSDSATYIGNPVDITKTKWKDLLIEVSITKSNGDMLDTPLFSIIKMPMVCKDDVNSPMGASIFADAIEELKDLDIAYSRNSYEMWQSKRIVLADEKIMTKPAIKDADGNIIRPKIKMPKFIRSVFGGSDEAKNYYQEINPELNTEMRKTGIDQQLSFIGYKCGYGNGYFVFDQKTGMVTATQVEADDQRTIQLIKDIRDALQNALNDLFYAMSVFADLYDYAPIGEYEVNYAFGDITYNYQEDKMQWWQYVQAGKVPAWMYFVKFEKMSEEEAKAMQSEIDAQNKDNGLYGAE